MTRETSAKAYEGLVVSGEVETLQAEVLAIIRAHGPMTSRDVWDPHFRDRGYQIDSIRPRVPELAKQGVICEVGKAVSRSSGRLSILWHACEGNAKPARRESWKAEALRLRKENAELRQRLEDLDGWDGDKKD